jgi:gluconokinase
MQSGRPLNDADRAPWLAAAVQVVDCWQAAGVCGVATCSALKHDRRRRISSDRSGVRLVYPDESCALTGRPEWAQ